MTVLQYRQIIYISRRIDHLKKMIADYPPILTELEPFTLTAQGKMSNISFNEENLINNLPEMIDKVLLK